MLNMQFSCVQSVVFVILAFLIKFNLLFTKISIYHSFRCKWSFSLSANVHVESIGTQNNFSLESVRKVLILES